MDGDRRRRLDFLLQLRPLSTAPDFEASPFSAEAMLDPAAGSRWPEDLPNPPIAALPEEDGDVFDSISASEADPEVVSDEEPGFVTPWDVSDESVYQGRFEFRRGDLGALAGDEDLASGLEAHEEAFRSLGFFPLGDVVCERFPEVVLRALGHEEQEAWGILGSVGLGVGWVDFYTLVRPGVSLTATTNFGAAGPLDRGVHYRHGPGPPENLWQLHQEGLRELAGDRGTEPAEASLQVFCAAVDEFLVRSTS